MKPPRDCAAAPELRKRVWDGPERRDRARDWLALDKEEQTAVGIALEGVQMAYPPRVIAFLRRHHGY